MIIRSTPTLHYPITVTKLLRKEDEDVDRFAPLFSYTYRTNVTEGDKYGEVHVRAEDFPATFESETEGRVSRWRIREGSVIKGPGFELLEIEEPCAHEIQWGGMCASCGKDMTEVNYTTSRLDSERAPISMSHGQTALTVSATEAARVEDEAKRRLLANRRLVLVVDLDQTIIHATVDPTVGEWQKDEDNPNHLAVKDVRTFQLLDEGPGYRDTWYYIKLRPGLEEFLENIAKIYELHIYTMGTRAYAEHIARIVDPDRKIFGDRILSRNESGSLTVKSLQRLFPIDTKMVVIIDDRGDVWHWSPNLVKVKPYDFFVGIGDINSSFLPKRQELPPTPPESPPTSPESTAIDVSPADQGGDEPAKSENAAPEVVPDPLEPSPASNGAVTAIQESLVELADAASDPETIEERSTQREEAIAAQITDRPLLQKQMMLDKADEEMAEKENNGEAQAFENGDSSRQKHNLLHDEDSVLDDLETSLRQIHRAFYERYDSILTSTQGGRIAELRGAGRRSIRPDELSLVPDVKDIIPPMKQRVFQGVTIVFSGVVPLGVNIHLADIAIWAKSFGAQVSEHITKKTTHVVAARQRRTAKVRQAARHSWIKIVTVDWLLESISQWANLDAKSFRIEVEPDEQHQSNHHLPSFDDLEDGPGLSSSEEEDGNVTDVATNDTNDTDDDDKEELEALAPAAGGDSAVRNMTAAQWDDLDAEMDELLNETDDGDDDDSDSASESEHSEASVNGNGNGIQQQQRTLKRKKGGSTNGEVQQEDDSSDASASGLGSRLQKRRKQVLARTTSLSNMTTVAAAAGERSSGLPSPEITGTDDEKLLNRATAQDGGAADNNGADADDNDNDDLEAELMAELEGDD